MDTDAMLSMDPDFQTVCDARRDAWIAAIEAEIAPLARCGGADDSAAEGA